MTDPVITKSPFDDVGNENNRSSYSHHFGDAALAFGVAGISGLAGASIVYTYKEKVEKQEAALAEFQQSAVTQPGPAQASFAGHQQLQKPVAECAKDLQDAKLKTDFKTCVEAQIVDTKEHMIGTGLTCLTLAGAAVCFFGFEATKAGYKAVRDKLGYTHG